MCLFEDEVSSRKATTGRSSVIAVKAIVLCHSEK